MRNYSPLKKIPAFCWISWGIFPFLFWGTLFSAPRPVDRDELGQVERLQASLETNPDFKIFLAESFEGDRPWKVLRGDSFLNQVELVAKKPPGEAFPREISLLQNFVDPSVQDQTSLLLQSYVENPKREHWFLTPKEPIVFPLGLPVQSILWVYSQGHALKLKLILSQKKSQDMEWHLGELNFFGWRRIAVPIYLPQKNTRLIQSFSLPISLKGLVVESLPNMKRGAFHLYFDNLSFLIDKSAFHYPGSEVQDTWGDKR